MLTKWRNALVVLGFVLLVAGLNWQAWRTWQGQVAAQAARALHDTVVVLTADRQRTLAALADARAAVQAADAYRAAHRAPPRAPLPPVPVVHITPEGDSLVTLAAHRAALAILDRHATALETELRAANVQISARDQQIVLLQADTARLVTLVATARRESAKWELAYTTAGTCRLLPGVPCPPWWAIFLGGVTLGVGGTVYLSSLSR